MELVQRVEQVQSEPRPGARPHRRAGSGSRTPGRPPRAAALYASIRSRTAARRARSAGAVEVGSASRAGQMPRLHARTARASSCPISQSRYRSGMLTTSTRAFGRPLRSTRRPRSTSAAELRHRGHRVDPAPADVVRADQHGDVVGAVAYRCLGLARPARPRGRPATAWLYVRPRIAGFCSQQPPVVALHPQAVPGRPGVALAGGEHEAGAEAGGDRVAERGDAARAADGGALLVGRGVAELPPSQASATSAARQARAVTPRRGMTSPPTAQSDSAVTLCVGRGVPGRCCRICGRAPTLVPAGC